MEGLLTLRLLNNRVQAGPTERASQGGCPVVQSNLGPRSEGIPNAPYPAFTLSGLVCALSATSPQTPDSKSEPKESQLKGAMRRGGNNRSIPVNADLGKVSNIDQFLSLSFLSS